MRRLTAALAALSLGLGAVHAEAQDSYTGSDDGRAGYSPEGFSLSLGVGQYRPNPGSDAFEAVYGGDNGPLVNLEFDFLIYRIPFVGPIGIGLSGAWAKFTGNACVAGTIVDGSCERTTEGASFTMFPVGVLAVVRVDVLARRTPVPLIFIGKVGFDSIFFIEEIGSNKTRGRTHGVRWAGAVALELNFVNRRRASALDDDWGINSSFIFVEVAGSDANSRAQLGDTFFWNAGLGLTF